MDTRLINAVENNAQWCALVCRTHGIESDWHGGFWVARRATPPLYPEAITLERDVAAGDLLEAASIKDSFASLALGDEGFTELFEASWIHLPSQPQTPNMPRGWSIVHSNDQLAQWVSAAGLEDVILAELVGDAAVRVVQKLEQDRITAGAILYRTGEVVGITNAFGAELDPALLWRDLRALISHEFPSRAVVGYERGADLAAACSAGFEVIGALRVWRSD